jgi:hypothetical protein
MYFGKDAHEEHEFGNFATNIFQRVAMKKITPTASRILVILTCNNHWDTVNKCKTTPGAVAITRSFSDITLLFRNGSTAQSTEQKGEIDAIQFCLRFFERPTIVQHQCQYWSFWAGAPLLDNLHTAVTTILHELMHTRLITDGAPRKDMNCTNVTIRVVDYGGVGMYDAHMCAAMASCRRRWVAG